jgi:hypothetical protein
MNPERIAIDSLAMEPFILGSRADFADKASR